MQNAPDITKAQRMRGLAAQAHFPCIVSIPPTLPNNNPWCDKPYRARINVDESVFDERFVDPLVSTSNLGQPAPPHSENVDPFGVFSEERRHRVHVMLV